MLEIDEEDLRAATEAIRLVARAEWARNDYFSWLRQHREDIYIRGLARMIGRSHRCFYRWADRAEETPAELRVWQPRYEAVLNRRIRKETER